MKYVPAIINEVRPDGTKISKVIVKVFPDFEDDKEYGQIPCDIFTDNIYFDVKELYEEAEEKNFDATFLKDTEDDGEIFGWDLADCWQNIGTAFIFLVTMFNLCDNKEETTTIIDSNGQKAGDLNYSLCLEMLEEDQYTPVNK